MQIKLWHILRLHGNAESLEFFTHAQWLEKYKQFYRIGDLSEIPESVEYRKIFRIQPFLSKSQIRRFLQRGSITEKKAEKLLQEMEKQYAKKENMKHENITPYVNMTSQSTGKTFSLFIGFGEILDKPMAGKFNSYGLSLGATVPWFCHTLL